MRKTFSILAAAAAALCTVACNKDLNQSVPDINPAAQDGDRCTITVGVSSGAELVQTKASADDYYLSDAEVKTLQILVFTGDALDAYKKVENTKETTINCSNGARTIYAVVNGEDLSGIRSKTSFLARTSNGTQMGLDNGFTMIGSDDVTLPSSEKINISVSHLGCRVFLDNIIVKFKTSGLIGKSLTVKKIYLVNAPMDINYGKTAAPTIWKNKMALDADCAAILCDEFENTVIPDGADAANDLDIVIDKCYYCYPNPTTTDSNSSTWCPRKTRLVIEAEVNGNTYYYPITLPILESNKSYEIANVTINHTGSDSPDIPVAFTDCQFKVTVAGWDTVNVTDGTTI